MSESNRDVFLAHMTLDDHISTAHSLIHLMRDLLLDQHNGDDPNDPAGTPQKLHACADSLELRLVALRAASERLHAAIRAAGVQT